MSRLQAPPPAPVRSMTELFAIAQAMETDAVAYYNAMAVAMRQRGSAALADVFDRLAAVERGHVAQVDDWSRRQHGAVPEPTRLRWSPPDTFDVPAGEASRSRLITPYGALAAAVRQEERAFTFWSYVAAEAADDEVRRAAEHMALEELEHVAILRRERRSAWHAERGTRAPSRHLTLADLAERERAIAALLAAAPEQIAGARRPELAEQARQAVTRLDALALDHGSEPVASLTGETCSAETRSGDAPASTDDLLAAAELLVDAYLAAAEQSQNDAVVSLMHDFAAMAVTRLAALHDEAPGT
ncbi:MAG: ferritin family protein [Rhodoplanes sp.]|uniref:ferritin-like domain-containing protein n=1 Tax=Rhodoplanes sp. TaxID=1968906 RepID=UPI0017E346F1|nr:ferritin family protein [Rhodoplanes sp.]NVO12456.1 ferritin family protein [Rhodoplanes sp.]